VHRFVALNVLQSSREFVVLWCACCSTSRCVLVLQSASSPIALPFLSDGARVHLNPRKPTRHIVAGLATALGGIGAPVHRYNVEQKESSTNYLWAHGSVLRARKEERQSERACSLNSRLMLLVRVLLCSATPWGPLSNTSSLSFLFGDLSVRNGVCARVSSSLRAVGRALATLQEFHHEFVQESDVDSTMQLASARANWAVSKHVSGAARHTCTDGLAHLVQCTPLMRVISTCVCVCLSCVRACLSSLVMCLLACCAS
jgi:hypothetical protein